MPSDIEHHYAELRKKHDLPDFAVLDKEFEISTIEKPAFLLRAIQRKMSARLDDLTQFLETLIQPDPSSFCNLIEYRALSEADRSEVLKNFQLLMALYRACIDAELAGDDAQDAAIIRRIASEWPGLRAAVRPFVQKIAAAWPKPFEHKGTVGYFG